MDVKPFYIMNIQFSKRLVLFKPLLLTTITSKIASTDFEYHFAAFFSLGFSSAITSHPWLWKAAETRTGEEAISSCMTRVRHFSSSWLLDHNALSSSDPNTMPTLTVPHKENLQQYWYWFIIVEIQCKTSYCVLSSHTWVQSNRITHESTGNATECKIWCYNSRESADKTKVYGNQNLEDLEYILSLWKVNLIFCKFCPTGEWRRRDDWGPNGPWLCWLLSSGTSS